MSYKGFFSQFDNNGDGTLDVAAIFRAWRDKSAPQPSEASKDSAQHQKVHRAKISTPKGPPQGGSTPKGSPGDQKVHLAKASTPKGPPRGGSTPKGPPRDQKASAAASAAAPLKNSSPSPVKGKAKRTAKSKADEEHEEDNPWVILFQEADTDHDGTLDRKEFADIFAKLQRAAGNDMMSSREVWTLFDAADTNGDGALQLSEFVAFLCSDASSTGSRQVRTKAGESRFGEPDRPEVCNRVFPYMQSGYAPSIKPHEAIVKFCVFNEEKLNELQALAAAKSREMNDKIAVAPKYCEILLAYTEESDLYKTLCKACRNKDAASTEVLDKHKDYLHYLIDARACLQNYVGTAFRCIDVRVDPGHYPVGQMITWWAPSSSSCEPLPEFLAHKGKIISGTLFILDVSAGKQISDFSVFPEEKEIIFGCNSQWSVEKVLTTEKDKRDALGKYFLDYDLTELDMYTMEQN